jgi:hypothetical protein
MHYSIRSAFLGIFFTPCLAWSAVPDRYCGIEFPQGILSEIAHQFPGWRVKTFEDLTGDHRTFWDGNHRGCCPGVLKGHFIKRDRDEYAAPLIPVNGVDGYKVVIGFKKNSKYKCLKFVDEKWDSKGTILGIVPKGSGVSEIEGKRHAVLKNDGLEVGDIGAGSQVYFWKHGHFDSIFVAD